MTSKQLDYVRATIDNEGFHYAFVNYSDFPEITDSEFHALRQAYVNAAKALSDYLNLED